MARLKLSQGYWSESELIVQLEFELAFLETAKQHFRD